ncbi:alpha/beta fold hydrolase [Haloarchaeobius sp. DYHT-AS-18]|uniref:S9 family peptidase n=1 Tax=Haloarchaeobius sp. DYHT-AS-18 TaxID=3446117 RepID=UPI003EB6E485
MSYDIERYLHIRSAGSASFSPDGERLSFLMDTTGVSQVWTIDEPGGWPDQRTFYDERVTFASWSPERDELVFGMDKGGNERQQFYRLSGDGREEVNLTEHPDAKHRWGGWSHDGERFAFTSNRRDESVFDVYVQGRDERGNEATLVHEGDGWLTVGGWSPDDSRLIVSQAYSNFDQDLYVLDIDSGDMRHVTPHEGNVRFYSATWAPDGDALYVSTDEGSDTLYLARLDLETLELETVVEGDGWNVDGIALDQDTGRFVYSRNVDGFTEITVGKFTGPTSYDTYPSPDLPNGIAGGVSWGPDAERFAITATGAAVNTNVYVVETETGETERWTYAATAGIPEETFREPELVHVESFDDLAVPGFLTLPDGYDEGEVPVIVSIHGGPESQRRPSFNPVKQYFLNRGYGYFEPNVRGSSGYGKAYSHRDDVRKRMDSVKDIEACVDWLHAHPAVDDDRLVAMGGSYGGFMVLACLTEYPDLWAAGVDVVGIANFVTFLENTGEWRRKLREAEYGSLEDDREFLESISPTNNIESIQAPLFVIHGENDPRVPVSEAHQIVEEARGQGVPVRELIFEDEGHGLSKLENKIEAYSAVAEFLDEHV